MILLSTESFADGLSAMLCLIFAWILGLGIIIHARRLNAKLLSYMGLNIFLAGFFWLVICCDFLAVLISGRNLNNPYGWMGIVHIMWAPLVLLISVYIGAELMVPKKKWYFVYPFLILSLIFEFFILINPLGTFYFEYPDTPGESLIIIMIMSNTPANLLTYAFEIFGLLFCGFGYLIKSFRSVGLIKNKFILLSIGYFLFIGFPIVAALTSRFGFFIPIVYSRIGMVSGFFFFYAGLRETPISKKKKEKRERIKKDVKVEESLFRLFERPYHISEEEVIFHKEKKICLVCKGKVLRVNYICPKCNALYCINCSEVLSNRENMCWVCDEPFDESKPISPYKRKIKKDVAKILDVHKEPEIS